MRIALVSMPWAIFNRPSIQLGTLKSYLDQHAKSSTTEVFHPYLGIAKRIGFEPYRIIAENSWAGEALYAALLFPEMHEQAKRAFTRSLGKRTTDELPAFGHLCTQLDDHLNSWLEENDLSGYTLIGFSVCFGQLPASLLAAQRIKKQYPKIKTVLGGSTCVPDIAASLLHVFAGIDYIICGEGEEALLRLTQLLQEKISSPGAGILSRETGTDPSGSMSGIEIPDLNSLPVPDYDGYFNEMKESGLFFIPQLPLEFSRGCWWNKCRFCNLNLQWCGYRTKTHKRVQLEVDHLTQKYRCLDFSFTDNALPPVEAERFFRTMSKSPADTKFFAEIRTINKPEQYYLFRNGGLHAVQIGIEAFSNSLLQRMNKGTTVMDNLMAMKLCAESGIQLDGNLILEFPGSTEEEVKETLRVLNFVLPYHPLTAARFFLGHGSPVWQEPAKYGIRSIRHHPYNRMLYPAAILKELDMLIMQGTGDRQYQRQLWQPVRKKMTEWHKFHTKRVTATLPLSYRDGGNFIIIRQELPDIPVQHHRLSGTSRKIYLACRTPVPLKSLLAEFNAVTEKTLREFLNDLETKKLMFRDNDVYLALAVHERAGN